MNPVKKIFKFFLIWRILLFIPIVLAVQFFPLGSSFPYSNVSYYKHLPEFFNIPIISTWSNFDGVHYFNIAASGYTTEARFFPFFPIVIFLLSFGSTSLLFTYITALILPNIFFLISLVILYKLLRLDYSEIVSFKTITNLLVFPTAFFFVAVYSESLYLLLLVLTFYYIRRGNWLWAILSAVLLVSTRLVGIFIVPAIIYEYFLQQKRYGLKTFFWIAAMIIVTPLGLLFYSIFNHLKWGSFMYFLTAHSELNNGRTQGALIIPFQTIYRYLKIFVSVPIYQYEFWIALLEMVAFFVVTVVLFLSFKKNIRKSYLIFSVPAFFLPAFSGTFSGLPRYALVILPFFVYLSLIKNEIFRRVYLFVSIPLLAILLMLFSRSYFVA